MAKIKRVMVSVTEEEAEKISKISHEILGRKNMSATLSYIIVQYEKLKSKEKENDDE